MNRLRLILVAVAAAIAGGTAISIALRQEANCGEWEQIKNAADNAPPFEWFVAIADTVTTPPQTAGDYVLGDCDAQGCELRPQGCGMAIRYRVQRSGSVAGWRAFYFKGPQYFARAWRELATQQPSQFKLFRSWRDVKSDCTAAGFSAANCRSLIRGVNDCWLRQDGMHCNNGLLFGPGVGGLTCSGNPAVCVPATCTLQAGDVPYPCTSERGPEWPDKAISETYADE